MPSGSRVLLSSLVTALASLVSLASLAAACSTGDAANPGPSPGPTPTAPKPTPTISPPPPPPPGGPGQVLTSKNDNGRTGANLDETVLDRSNVATLKLRRTWYVDGELYAQPLVAADVTTPTGKKSLVIAATMNDSIFAFDLDGAEGAPPVWHAGKQRELGNPGSASRNVVGPNGILSTPVIDRANEIVYAVARDCSPTKQTTYDRCGTPTPVPACRERLFAIALGTGAVIASVDVAGATATSTRQVVFDPSVHWNRPALLLAGDALYVAFGSGPNGNDHEEGFEYHGWVFRYDARALDKPPAVFNASPHTSGASVWQAGAGPAADETHVYFATANDIRDCSTKLPSGFPPSPTDAEDSIVRLPHAYASTDVVAAPASAPVANAFGSVASYGDARIYTDTRAYTAAGFSGTVFQFASSGDNGFGSSGPTLIPDSRALVVGSKSGQLYLLDRDTMEPLQKPLSAFDKLPLQGDHTLYLHSWWGLPMLPGSLAFHRTTAARGLVYGWPKGDVLRSFAFDYVARTLAPDKLADVIPNPQGGYLSITSDRAHPEKGAMLWATAPAIGIGGGGMAMAFDAVTLETLWTAFTPAFSKFTPPTVARGRVVVPSAIAAGSTALLVYGLP